MDGWLELLLLLLLLVRLLLSVLLLSVIVFSNTRRACHGYGCYLYCLPRPLHLPGVVAVIVHTGFQECFCCCFWHCIPTKLATQAIEYDYNNCWVVNMVYVNVSQEHSWLGRV